MQKRAPTLGNIIVIILFVLSCFGLLLFLWSSFGGPLPLKAKGYRFEISFPRALALSEQSDVRISGVEVGHVVSVNAGPEGRSVATVEISNEYAPLRETTQAILRQKTLLGETFVQLIPRAQVGPNVPDGGKLPNSTFCRRSRSTTSSRRSIRRRATRSKSGNRRLPEASTDAENRSTRPSRACSRSPRTPTSC